MRMLICACGGHEFVVFTGGWLSRAKDDLAAPVYAACTQCGDDWNLETVFWVDDSAVVGQPPQKETP